MYPELINILNSMLSTQTPLRLKTLIVDDERRSRLHLKRLIDTYCHQLQVAGTAASGEEATGLISKLKPDLVFLDVLMPTMNGFEFLATLKRRDFLTVFVTAHEEFGIKAVQADATDYVLKPIDTLDLQRAVSHVMKVWQERSPERSHTRKSPGPDSQSSHKITVPYAEGFHILDAAKIIRLEADNTYTTICMEEGRRLLSSKGIHEFEEILEPRCFMRIHRSHVVNLNYVQEFNRKYDQVVILTNGDKVPVARRKLKDFHDHLQNYIGRV